VLRPKNTEDEKQPGKPAREEKGKTDSEESNDGGKPDGKSSKDSSGKTTSDKETTAKTEDAKTKETSAKEKKYSGDDEANTDSTESKR